MDWQALLKRAGSELLTGVTSTAAQQVAAQAGSSPQLQAALAQAQVELKRARLLAWALGLSWAATFVFYVVPRMEAPIPRALRRAR